MAGHSKFKNIMHRKGAQDKKRGKIFSKLGKEITVAAKMGSPDPDMNPRLRTAIQAAKAQTAPSSAARTLAARITRKSVMRVLARGVSASSSRR